MKIKDNAPEPQLTLEVQMIQEICDCQDLLATAVSNIAYGSQESIGRGKRQAREASGKLSYWLDQNVFDRERDD